MTVGGGGRFAPSWAVKAAKKLVYGRVSASKKVKICVADVVILWYATGYSLFHGSPADRESLVRCQSADGGGGEVQAGHRRLDLPNYRLSEITARRTADTGVWVTFGEGVYDITDFMIGHPGGDKIGLAAGGSVEPFWDLYAIHHTEHVYAILETLRVGNIDPADMVSTAPPSGEDPYSHEPRRHPALQVTGPENVCNNWKNVTSQENFLFF